MEDEYIFYPVRARGVIFHLVIALLLTSAGVMGVILASRAQAGPAFLLALAPVLLGVIFAPVAAYRAYALLRARYTLERDGIRLQWGWRVEDIPINGVLWVEERRRVTNPPPLPALRLFGVMLGKKSLPGGQVVEYLADSPARLVLIATTQGMFGVSPTNPQEFVEQFERLNEMGSLTPLPAHSVYPGRQALQFWEDIAARSLFLCGALLCLILLVWVSLAIPSLSQVSLRLTPAGEGAEYVPAVQLLLLPVLNILFFLVDTVLSLFFYRREETRSLVYLLWGSGVITSILFLGAVFFILRAG